MSNDLPEELLIEILSRVPVKSLVRFLVVSKSWHSLITSPNFITYHLNNVRQQKIFSNSSPTLIRRYTNDDRKENYEVYQDSAGKSTELKFPLKSQVGYFRVVGACDGLVCVSDDLFTVRKPIYLWNPAVRKYVELPSPTIDPLSPHMFVLGFGVDSHGVYKVVRIVYHKEKQVDFTLPPEVEVYSLSVGCWKKIMNININVFITDFLWSQVFLNGSVHWISYAPRKNKNGGQFSSSILRFDLESELFNEVPLPDELSCTLVTNLVINVYRDYLAVIGYHRAEGYGYCSIWVMKQYGVLESWTRLFTIDLVEGLERVVGFQKNGDVLLLKGGEDLVVFNPKTNGFRNLGVVGTPRSFYACNLDETLNLLERQHVFVEEEQGTEDDHNFEEVGGNDYDEDSSRTDGKDY